MKIITIIHRFVTDSEFSPYSKIQEIELPYEAKILHIEPLSYKTAMAITLAYEDRELTHDIKELRFFQIVDNNTSIPFEVKDYKEHISSNRYYSVIEVH